MDDDDFAYENLKKDGSRRSGTSQSTRLVNLAGAAELWHSPDREAYASIRVGDHWENQAVGSKDFRRWLCGRYFDEFNSAPGGQAVADALRVIEVKASRGPEFKPFVRIGHAGEAIYLDLGDPDWHAVKITRLGWAIIRDPPVKFLRSASTISLPEPERGESVEILRPYLNVASEGDFRLAIACVVGWFMPDGPYPILVLSGEQGSAKSTMARTLRDLVDPRFASARSLPATARDLYVSAEHSFVLSYDNVSYIQGWLSDEFCRLATGAGFGTRELHSDRGEVIFSFCRPIMLNGIPETVGRQDLADRAIGITLSAIPETARQTERKFKGALDEVLPFALGAILDAVSGALCDREDVALDRMPRMADFATWITAAERSLGWERGSVIEAYDANRLSAVTTIVENDPVANAVRLLVSDHVEWVGTTTELLVELEARVSEEIRKSRSWPKAPNRLSQLLRRAAPALRQLGVTVGEASTGGRNQRKLIVLKRAEDDEAPGTP